MKKNPIIPAISFLVLFIIFTVLTALVDVAAIGPAETEIGFSTINGAVRDYLGTTAVFETISNILLYISLAVAAAFAVTGLIMLITRKSLFKVDAEILSLGVVYLIVFATYFIFRDFPINYRPIIDAGEIIPESSYPSSHIMITATVFMCLFVLCKRYFGNNNTLRIVCVALTAISVITRILSGFHWFTDEIGAMLFAAFLVSSYAVVCHYITVYKNEHKS